MVFDISASGLHACKHSQQTLSGEQSARMLAKRRYARSIASMTRIARLCATEACVSK